MEKVVAVPGDLSVCLAEFIQQYDGPNNKNKQAGVDLLPPCESHNEDQM